MFVSIKFLELFRSMEGEEKLSILFLVLLILLKFKKTKLRTKLKSGILSILLSLTLSLQKDLFSILSLRTIISCSITAFLAYFISSFRIFKEDNFKSSIVWRFSSSRLLLNFFYKISNSRWSSKKHFTFSGLLIFLLQFLFSFSFLFLSCCGSS